MIVQIWQGIALASNVNQCQRFLNEQVLPYYQNIDGNLGVYLCREVNEQLVNFLFLSIWESQESLEKFASLGIEAAIHSQAKGKLLLAFESTTRDYEVFQWSEPETENRKQ